jgi:hypothetical protein
MTVSWLNIIFYHFLFTFLSLAQINEGGGNVVVYDGWVDLQTRQTSGKERQNSA